MNDKERAMWIDNDENLYRLWLNSRASKTKFIKLYRDRIDEYITAQLNNGPENR